MNNIYRIVKLKVQNFKNLKAIEITPDGNVITLTGDNGAGKSALLDAVQNALAGKDGAILRPIRDGSNAADVDIDLGHGLTAHRRHTPGGSTLTVKLKDEKQGSPQAILDGLTNGIVGFDPFAFTRLKPADQRETFLKLVGLDFTQHDKDRQAVYTARTEANREVERTAARLSGLPPHDPSAPASVASASELIAKLEEAQKCKQERNRLTDRVTVIEGDVQKALLSISEAEKQIAAWQLSLKQRQEAMVILKLSLLEAKNAPLPEVIDETAIRTSLASIESDNAKLANNAERAKWEIELAEEKAKVANLNRAIETADNAKAEAIRNAKSPLDGLTFDDAGLIYNGRPLTEASTGHRIRVAVAIGMALKPSLRVIFVRDGSLLDEEGLKVIAEMAKANDYQVWIEDARSEDPAALVIEDGQLLVEHEKV